MSPEVLVLVEHWRASKLADKPGALFRWLTIGNSAPRRLRPGSTVLQQVVGGADSANRSPPASGAGSVMRADGSRSAGVIGKPARHVDVALQAEQRRNAHLRSKHHELLAANGAQTLTDVQLVELRVCDEVGCGEAVFLSRYNSVRNGLLLS